MLRYRSHCQHLAAVAVSPQPPLSAEDAVAVLPRDGEAIISLSADAGIKVQPVALTAKPVRQCALRLACQAEPSFAGEFATHETSWRGLAIGNGFG